MMCLGNSEEIWVSQGWRKDQVPDDKSVGWEPELYKVGSHHKAGDRHSSDPLLPNFLDLGLVTGRNGSAHNGQTHSRGSPSGQWQP